MMRAFSRTPNVPLREARILPTARWVCGFTLIETMVAITILTLAVSGAFFTANSSLVAANIARDQLTASYLAQEGIEYVRMLRDNAYLAAYYSPTGNTTNAFADFLAAVLVKCPTGDCDPTTSLGLVPKATFTTNFTRKIQITPLTVTDKDEKIVSTVTWKYHNTTYSVTITDHLTPWQ